MEILYVLVYCNCYFNYIKWEMELGVRGWDENNVIKLLKCKFYV